MLCHSRRSGRHTVRSLYVAHDDSLERSRSSGTDTTSLVEVTNGLREGELVVLELPEDVSKVEWIWDSAEQNKEATAGDKTVASSQN